jgi:hypothetical protein
MVRGAKFILLIDILSFEQYFTDSGVDTPFMTKVITVLILRNDFVDVVVDIGFQKIHLV